MQQATSESARIDIRYVAKLARLALDEAEIERYERELGTLLDHVSELSELPTENVAATAQVIESHNVAREDIVVRGLERDAFLAGAPASQNGLVRVPRIIAETE
jgi:aspartyl-tRNA(Asn)/glutamyl-tRNA(Gln) amidotransferase subunit C